MAEFGPDAKGRLPLPTDPDILKQSGIVHLGVGLLLCAGIALAQLF